jgi:hypothetical protein
MLMMPTCQAKGFRVICAQEVELRKQWKVFFSLHLDSKTYFHNHANLDLTFWRFAQYPISLPSRHLRHDTLAILLKQIYTWIYLKTFAFKVGDTRLIGSKFQLGALLMAPSRKLQGFWCTCRLPLQ